MADVKLNKNTFKILVGVMIAVIILLVGILIIHFAAPGIIAGITGLFGPDEPVPGIEEEEEGPWGDKTYSWKYQGQTLSAYAVISKDIYKKYNTSFGKNPSSYIIANDEDGAVRSIASAIQRAASQYGYSGQDTVDCAAAFVKSLSYKTDRETGHTGSYPRTPVVTLAEGVGDSEDLSILAAAILDSLGYSAAVISYDDITFNQKQVPHAAALGIPGTSNAEGPVYNLTKNTVSKDIEIIWVADTASKGYPAAAYYIEEPAIYPAPNFWTGKTADSTVSASLPTAEIYQIPDLTYIPDISSNTWKKEMSEYYKGQWYDTHVKWNSSASWKLYEHYFTVQPTPYAKPAEDGVLPGALWRLNYTVTPTVSGNVGVEELNITTSSGGGFGSLAQKTVELDFTGMTPYSSAEIAVYDMASGEPVLLDTFGWQGTASADKNQTSPSYPPGKYAIGLFVRNANVDITVQCIEDLNAKTYQGGI